MWTRFYDMHSGGGQKLDWPIIYIEVGEEKAASVFELVFNRNPNHVTCNCCGKDYSYDTYETLKIASTYDRDDRFGDMRGMSIEDMYKDNEHCKVVTKEDLVGLL